MQCGWIERMIQYLGLWVLFALCLNMWALISVFRSGAKWTVRGLWFIVLLVPVLGFIAWYILGPREAAA